MTKSAQTAPLSRDACDLLLQGSLVFAAMEEAGIAVDVPYLERVGGKAGRRGQREGGTLQAEIDAIRAKLSGTPEGKAGLSIYGRNWDPGNNHMLGAALVKSGHDLPTGKKGATLTNKEVLEDVEGEFIELVRRMRKLEQVRNTYVADILRETVDGYIHPNFNLHTVKTFRPSTDSPNQANVPRRDEEAQQIVRKGIIPSAGHQLVEFDYKGNELKLFASHTNDPVLVADLKAGRDLHHHEAMDCFILKSDEVSKAARDVSKNGFVFPEVYGSWWDSVARNMWQQVKIRSVKTKAGALIMEHLRSKGITGLGGEREFGHKRNDPAKGTFLHHVRGVEDRFWKRYAASREWQEDFYDQYLDRGWFVMPTGFRCSGLTGKNNIYNYTVQGSGFHCLLWSLVQIHREMASSGMKTALVNQIYDSAIFDAVPEEVDDLCELVRRVMVDEVPKHWPWIAVPLGVEASISEVDGSWADMKPLDLIGEFE